MAKTQPKKGRGRARTTGATSVAGFHIRAPSTTSSATSAGASSESAAPTAPPPVVSLMPTAFTNLGKSAYKTRAHTEAERRDAAGEALLRARAKVRADAPPPPVFLRMDPERAQRWVYVGNLDPETTEAHLRVHFSGTAGPVERVSVRYSGSTAAATCYRYAIVEFGDAAAAERALLHMNGKPIVDSAYDLVVTHDPTTLPEIQRLPEMHALRIQVPNIAAGLPERTPLLFPAAPGENNPHIGQIHTASGIRRPPSAIVKTKLWPGAPPPPLAPSERKRRHHKKTPKDAQPRSWRFMGHSFAMTLA